MNNSRLLLDAEILGRAVRICRQVAEANDAHRIGAEECVIALQGEVSRLLARIAQEVPK
jgi:hypothetical protein